MIKESFIYNGKVIHKRFKPKKHFFKYNVFSLFLDLSEIKEIDKRISFFSYNKFNLISFYEKDHGQRDGTSLRKWVDEELSKQSINLDGGKVYLFSMPRILGYAFNPLSVFLCYKNCGTLGAIIYEVKNTHGEQHCYTVKVLESELESGTIIHEKEKTFFVSPFIGMEARYRFRIATKDKQLSFFIRVYSAIGDLMVATLRAEAFQLSDWSLLLVFAKAPIMTFKVIFGIHYEALRLWLKRVPFHKHVPIQDLRS